jgi:hypothetical protein
MNKNTMRRIEQIVGYGISDTEGKRTFTPVDGILYVDLFEGDIPEELGVKSFNGRKNGVTYFNQIELSKNYSKSYCKQGDVTLELNWGSNEYNEEIKGLADWLEENPAVDNLDDAGVKSKKIEDFSVTKGTAAETQADINIILHDGYGYYIRRPLIVGVSQENKDASRYF